MDVDGFDKNKKESQSDKPDWLLMDVIPVFDVSFLVYYPPLSAFPISSMS